MKLDHHQINMRAIFDELRSSPLETVGEFNKDGFFYGVEMNYSEKLKDPRWQKKRLEIFQRDEFMCKFCLDNESTLNIHHLKYSNEPWNVENKYLITLCESCHEHESMKRKKRENELLEILRVNEFSVNSLEDIIIAFDRIEMIYPPDVIASIIKYNLTENMKEISELYFKNLSKKSNIRQDTMLVM